MKKELLASEEEQHQNNWGRWPYFSQKEIDAVIKVLESGKINYWTGDQCKLFEKSFSSFCGVNHGITLANGTVALELALQAIAVQPKDEVIVSPRTFLASASAILMRGAIPVFADVNVESQNITAKSIEQVITPRSKAIITVHLAGWPCDMDPIMTLAKAHNLYVIEDCAQAHGSCYNEKKCGSLGDVAAFSFCQDKILTIGGEGGMLVTDEESIWQKAWSFKDHGKNNTLLFNKKPMVMTEFNWIHDKIGTNWRMTEMQAAIGLVQLSYIETWLKKRNEYATILNGCFSKIKGLRVTIPNTNIVRHAYYKYYVFIEPSMLKSNWSRERIMSEIHAAGVPCFLGSCSEIYLEKVLAPYAPKKRLQNAKLLGETSLMFPVHPTLTYKNIQQICDVVSKVMAYAIR